VSKLDDLRAAVKVAREKLNERDAWADRMSALLNVTNAAEAYLAELDAEKAKPRVMADWEKAGIVLNPKHFETYPPEKKEPK
jgi:hypothetical protein